MASLGDTVAELLARARADVGAGSDTGANLRLAPSFGSNPGALRMWLHTPERLPARAPLVVVLHGCGQTAAGYAKGAGWLELADQHGFAVLCPEQVRTNNANLCFNWFEDGDTRRGSGEAASIAQMVRQASEDLDLDAQRVFVTGLSAGGAMAAVMLATYPELFAAGAVIAGLPYGAASGVAQAFSAMRRVPDLSAKAWGDKVRSMTPSPDRWPRIAIWHGEADSTVTPAAADASVLQWCDLHGATRRVEEPSITSGHAHAAWLSPDGAVAVEQHRISGLGHGTPIASQGPDGCGTPAPWILEAGVSSSREIAGSWGLAGALDHVAAGRATAKPVGNGETATQKRRSPATDVSDIIAKALRGAGLMR